MMLKINDIPDDILEEIMNSSMDVIEDEFKKHQGETAEETLYTIIPYTVFVGDCIEDILNIGEKEAFHIRSDFMDTKYGEKIDDFVDDCIDRYDIKIISKSYWKNWSELTNREKDELVALIKQRKYFDGDALLGYYHEFQMDLDYDGTLKDFIDMWNDGYTDVDIWFQYEVFDKEYSYMVKVEPYFGQRKKPHS